MIESPTGPAALARIFRDAERGSLPTPDGAIRVIRQPSGDDAAVVAFTSSVLVAADIEPAWVADRLAPGELSASMNPPFLTALCERVGREVNGIDLVAYAPALEGPPPIDLRETTFVAHQRVSRARRFRTEARVWTVDGGVLVLGVGLGGRIELAFEVDPDRRGSGRGRALARSARHLVSVLDPDRHGVWAQVAPGNAASVRTLLAAGFVPMGGEALLVTP
ncbi:MAG TPA: GNAT family N-acetyltransferase [Nocardioidaceae bacterium]|nr:GNAT family N-acetyltransferase [Nocardioidaceae bacterium]